MIRSLVLLAVCVLDLCARVVFPFAPSLSAAVVIASHPIYELVRPPAPPDPFLDLHQFYAVKT